MGKRQKHITVNLTEEENALLNRLCEIYERKPADLARILLNGAMLREWGKIQVKEHPENAQPFQPIKLKVITTFEQDTTTGE